MKSVTENLFEDYRNSRSSDISIDQFRVLLRLFPSLLVCMSDGKFDEEEQQGMLQNLQSNLLMMEDEYADDHEQKLSVLREEIDYLAGHAQTWKLPFLSAIRWELSLDPDDKEYIMESLYLFANIHEGICIEEQIQIDELINELQLAV